jgi:plastocyanin
VTGCFMLDSGYAVAMTKRALVITCTALLFAAGCSSGNKTAPTTTPPATTPPATTSAPPASGEVTIQEVEFSFQPAQITANTSQPIVITNNGTALHNFSIEGTSISVDTQPGDTTRLEAPGPSFAPGTYTFFCKYHRAQGMVGTLVASAG